MKPKPTEIWGLQFDDGRLVCPTLDDDGTNSFLAFPTEEEAIKGAAFQNKHYLEEDPCTPVKLM